MKSWYKLLYLLTFQCSEMISIYGISIMRLSERAYMDQSHICAEIGKCFDSEKSALAFARISGL